MGKGGEALGGGKAPCCVPNMAKTEAVGEETRGGGCCG